MVRGTTPGFARRLLAMLLLACVSVACASAPPRQGSGDRGPGTAYFEREEIPFPETQADPFEPVNRSMAFVNDQLIIGVLDPVARIYRRVVPGAIRRGIHNATNNLLFPRHFVNNVLQWKLRGAVDETARFFLNSSVGLAGLFDPATRAGIKPSPEDTGQTLARWGWRRSRFLVLPVFGPGNVRDAVGLAGDALMAPENLFLPSGSTSLVAGVRLLNNHAERVDTYSRFLRRELDPYVLTRQIYGIERHLSISDFRSESSAATDTLRSVYLGFRDPEFPGRARTHNAQIAEGDRSILYDLWQQPVPAPLVVVLPGLAAHRQSDASLGLAELAFGGGFSVASMSDALNWEFIRHASGAAVPGDPETDARDVAAALEAMLADLEERYPGRITRRALLGVSLGGFHALLIAADGSVPFDRVVAINPPVRLRHGMEQVDAYYNAPLEWPAEEREDRVRETLMKALSVGESGLRPSQPLPFTDREARFLIGLNFRMDLRDVIFETQRRNDRGVLASPLYWLWREPAYREITEYSFMEYFYAFVLPYILEEGSSVHDADSLFDRASLRAREPELRAVRDRLRIFTNDNDFLLDKTDIAWLQDVLGPERVGVFARGGHLGNLHDPEVQRLILLSLEDLHADPPSR